jgi:hypothetical protein
VIFRREPIHKKLARDAGLEQPDQPEVLDPGPHWGETGIHGVPRPRRWDAVGSAEAPGLTGDEVHFVVLPNGDLVVDEDIPPDTLAPLAEAVEQAVERPFRAEGINRGEEMWAVAARRVRIAEIDAAGDELELTVHDGERTLKVDGERTFGSVPELELLGESESPSYVVRAVRLEGRLWEVEVTAL